MVFFISRRRGRCWNFNREVKSSLIFWIPTSCKWRFGFQNTFKWNFPNVYQPNERPKWKVGTECGRFKSTNTKYGLSEDWEEQIKGQRQQVFWGSFGESIKGATSVPGYSASQQEYWVARLRFVGYSTNTNMIPSTSTVGYIGRSILSRNVETWRSMCVAWIQICLICSANMQLLTISTKFRNTCNG